MRYLEGNLGTAAAIKKSRDLEGNLGTAAVDVHLHPWTGFEGGARITSCSQPRVLVVLVGVVAALMPAVVLVRCGGAKMRGYMESCINA